MPTVPGTTTEITDALFASRFIKTRTATLTSSRVPVLEVVVPASPIILDDSGVRELADVLNGWLKKHA